MCGGLAAPRRPAGGPPPLALTVGEGPRDVHVRINQYAAELMSRLAPEAADLLYLAAYVYAADQALSRGTGRPGEYGGRWRRRLRFEVPVRRPDLWNRPAVRDALAETLAFLTDDDEYEFHFRPGGPPGGGVQYLHDSLPPGAGAEFEEVVPFSGGLDSLAGAAHEVLGGRRRLVLTSHRPVGQLTARQRGLARLLAGRLGDPRLAPFHVGLAVNLGDGLGRDHTQRSRSFLFAALAAVTARAFGLRRVRFYENGVTSLNLAISPQVIGGRASRTTHPRALAGFARVFTAVFGEPFAVENPFQWKTKAEVLEHLAATRQADLCRLAVSCAHTRGRTRRHPHCGVCSQCVDRRVSVLAAGLAAHDPVERYEVDPLTGPRDGAALLLAEGYAGAVRVVERLTSPVELGAACGELSDILPHAGLPTNRAAAAVLDLTRRHAAGVRRVLTGAVAAGADGLVGRDCPPNSLIGAALGLVPQVAAGTPPAAATAGGPSPGDGSHRLPAATELVIDDGLFEVRARGASCRLGNTIPFRLVRRLNQERGRFVRFRTLLADVWTGRRVGPNTIHKTVCNVRRLLRDRGLVGVEIEAEPDAYRLVVTGG